VQKWEYYWVLAHLEGGDIEPTIILERQNGMQEWSPSARPTGRIKPLPVGEPKIEPEPELTVLAINGKRPKESLSMYILANELGEQGWELVNIEHTTRKRQIVSMWVFKRLKPENL
jgi:hypothetical protein